MIRDYSNCSAVCLKRMARFSIISRNINHTCHELNQNQLLSVIRNFGPRERLLGKRETESALPKTFLVSFSGQDAKQETILAGICKAMFLIWLVTKGQRPHHRYISTYLPQQFHC